MLTAIADAGATFRGTSFAHIRDQMLTGLTEASLLAPEHPSPLNPDPASQRQSYSDVAEP
jgi:hypothetical protein